MKRTSYFLCLLLVTFSGSLLMGCTDKEEVATPQEMIDMNRGVTGSSAAVSGLLKPEDLGPGWYEGSTNQFLRPQDISKSAACDGNRNYIKQEQSGLSAESQHNLNKLIGTDKPDVNEQLRVFKKGDDAAKVVQAQQALFAGGQWKACLLDKDNHYGLSQGYVEAKPSTQPPAGGAAYRMESQATIAGTPTTFGYERYVWASGNLLITIEVQGESQNLDKAFIDTILAKADSDAQVLNKSK